MSNASSSPEVIKDSPGPFGRWRTSKGIKSKDTKPKNFGGAWRVVLKTLGIFLVSQVLATGIVLLLLKVDGGGTIDNALNNSAPDQFVYTFFAEALAIAIVLQILKRRHLSLASIGLVKPKWNDLWKGLLGFVAFYIVLAFISQIVVNFLPGVNTDQQQDVGFNSLVTHWDTILAFVSLVILPPLGEEILVRGYLYSGLRSKWRFVPALVVTSIIFGAAHLQFGSGAPLLWTAAIDTFTLSLVLVYLREKTGALYAGMLVHSLNNFIAFFAHFHSALF